MRPQGIISGQRKAKDRHYFFIVLAKRPLNSSDGTPIVCRDVLSSTKINFLQNQNCMLLIGVYSLSACDVPLLPSWTKVAILVRQHIPDLISD